MMLVLACYHTLHPVFVVDSKGVLLQMRNLQPGGMYLLFVPLEGELRTANSNMSNYMEGLFLLDNVAIGSEDAFCEWR